MKNKEIYREHWDNVYQGTEVDQLGWYEAAPEPSLSLIQECALPPDAPILTVGAGASTLVDELLAAHFRHIIVNDISPTALDKLKQRLGEKQQKIQWVVDDLTNPQHLPDITPVALWHDRAVLHFFHKPEEQETYFQLLKKLVRPGGFVILAAFHVSGAAKCSGLPVHRYDQYMLADRLGPKFTLRRAFDHTYTMPAGDQRPNIYTLFQRT